MDTVALVPHPAFHSTSHIADDLKWVGRKPTCVSLVEQHGEAGGRMDGACIQTEW